MQVRGEANAAVSINKASLEEALISGCTGAVLFPTVPLLTLQIPNGFIRETMEHHGRVVECEGPAWVVDLKKLLLCPIFTHQNMRCLKVKKKKFGLKKNL